MIKLVKRLCYIVIFLYSSVCFRKTTEFELVKQGKVVITKSDIEGFSYSMPKDLRNGFFDSLDRLDSTLTNMLKIKHVVNYVNVNQLVDKGIIEQITRQSIQNRSNEISRNQLNDLEYMKYKKYLELIETYKYFKNKFMNELSYDNLEEFAQEQYQINKEQYYHQATRDISYITISYNDDSKELQNQVSHNLYEDIKVNKISFSEAMEKYSENKTIQFIDNINDYYYNEKYKDFSDFVFKTKKLGLVNEILDAKDRFIIAIVNKIMPERYDNFNEVKENIIAEIKKEKAEREFNNLILKLTQDNIEVNQEAIAKFSNK